MLKTQRRVFQQTTQSGCRVCGTLRFIQDALLEQKKRLNRFELNPNKWRHQQKINPRSVADDVILRQADVQEKHAEYEKCDTGADQGKATGVAFAALQIIAEIAQPLHDGVTEQAEQDLRGQNDRAQHIQAAHVHWIIETVV